MLQYKKCLKSTCYNVSPRTLPDVGRHDCGCSVTFCKRDKNGQIGIFNHIKYLFFEQNISVYSISIFDVVTAAFGRAVRRYEKQIRELCCGTLIYSRFSAFSVSRFTFVLQLIEAVIREEDNASSVETYVEMFGVKSACVKGVTGKLWHGFLIRSAAGTYAAFVWSSDRAGSVDAKGNYWQEMFYSKTKNATVGTMTITLQHSWHP